MFDYPTPYASSDEFVKEMQAKLDHLFVRFHLKVTVEFLGNDPTQFRFKVTPVMPGHLYPASHISFVYDHRDSVRRIVHDLAILDQTVKNLDWTRWAPMVEYDILKILR